LRRSALAHKAVGVNLAEHSAPPCIDGCRILRLATLQAQEFKVIAVELHEVANGALMSM
jgi:hypothetical protein